MDEEELVHELVNSLAFEVEAIPKDNVIKFTSTNGTPLNVKVRVRNKDEPRLVQRGIVSVPKLGKHIASVDKIRLISSDQTILSFNVYMEIELEKQGPPKNRKHGFKFFKLGGCLGTSYDEDEGPYLPGPSNNKALRSRTSSKSDSNILNQNADVAETLKSRVETSNRNQKKLFGKCKPGGCLDPPFGEDKEPYRLSSVQTHIKPKQTVSKIEHEDKAGQSISKSTVEQGRSSKTSDKILRKEPNKETTENKALLDIYARSVSLEHSTTSNYSNATLRHSSRMSSSKILDAGKNTSKTYNNDSLRQSYQYPETYFIPPKDILQHKEEERRYSRERSIDQIRPTTTRQENERQTSDDSHNFDVPNKTYPGNVDIRSPQTTKLSKQKVKDNKEKIKQTLTDLTSNEIDNPPKSSADYRKNNDISLNMPLVTQKLEISSDYKETPSVSYFKHVDDFAIPILPKDLDFSIISKSDSMDAKNKEQHQNLISTENKAVKNISSDKLNKPENSSTDTKNQNILKNKEAMKSETINTAKPKLGNIEDLYISPTLVSAQDEVKILRSMPSTDTQTIRQVDYSPSDLNIAMEDKPAKTSDSSNLSKDQTKLSMAIRLQSLEKDLDTGDTNKKNNTTPEIQLNDIVKNENPPTDMRNQNILKNKEAMKSETTNTAKPKLGNIEDLYISPTLVSDQDEVKILRSVPSTDTQKIPQVDYSPADLNITLKDKPAKTSDSSNLKNDQIKLSMALRLQSLEKVLDTGDTNKKNNTTPEIQLNDIVKNENPPTDMRNQNILKNKEAMKSETTNTAKPKLGNIEDLYISPTLVSDQDEVKILRSVPSTDTQKIPQVDYSPADLNITLKDKPAKTSDSSNLKNDQIKLSMALRLQSLEKVLDTDGTNKITKPETHLKDNVENDIRDNNDYLDTANYEETIKSIPDQKIAQEQGIESQGEKNKKQVNENPKLSDSGVNDEKINKSLRTAEIPKKPLKQNKNVLQEQIPDSQLSDNFKINEIQKSLNDFKNNQDSEKNKSEVLDLNFIHNEKLNDLLDVETHNRTLEDNLGKRNSRDTPNISEVKNELQTTNLNLQNKAPSEIFYKEVLDEQLRKPKQNDNKEIITKNMPEASIAKTFINDSKSNNHVVITPKFKDVSLNNDKDFAIVKTQEPGDTTNIASEDLKKNDEQIQDSKYAKSNLHGNQANNNIEHTFVSDDKKQTLIENIVNNNRIKQQPIDTSIEKHQTYSIQKSSNSSIVNSVNEFAMSSTNKMDASNNLKTNNFNFVENKKVPGNVNLTENDNVKLKNTLIPDQNSLNTQDRIPSAILQKTQLLRTDDSDFCNDDINVIKPFKRNTFTIVASNTSLEKQEEPISTQDTSNVLVTDEHFNVKMDEKKSPSIETTTDLEEFAENNLQKNNGIDKQEIKTADSILNSNPRDNTSLKMTKDDQSIKTYSERENKSELFELLENKKASNTEVTSSTRYEEPFRTNNYAKSSLTSDITPNTINIVNTEILRNQDQPDTIMNNKEKLILKNVSSDMAKQLSELLENPDDGSKNVPLEPKLEITPLNKEISGNDVPNDKLNDITMDNKTVQIMHSQLPENTDNIPKNKISTSDILKNSKGADSVLVAEFTEDTKNVTHGEIVSITRNDNSGTNSTRDSMEYRSEFHEDEIGKSKNSPVNILQSTEISEPDESKFKLFSQAKSEKIGDSELDVQPSHTKDPSDIMIMANVDNDITKKLDLGTLGSLSKVTDKTILEEDIRFYVENETGAGNLGKISNSETNESFSKIIEKKSLEKDDSMYYNEYDHDTKMYEVSDLKNTSESASVADKANDQIPISSIDNTGNYSEYDSLTKVNEHVDLRKQSKQASERNFIEVIDEKPLLVEDDVAHDVKHEKDGTLKKISEANSTVASIIDMKPLEPKEDTRYYGEYAPLSKTPISIDNLSNIDQSGVKKLLDTKKLLEQRDSIILKQQLGVKEKVYNQNGNKLNRTDYKETILSPVHKTKSEVLFLNLALQSYVNDNNETVVQTISPMVEPLRYTDDNITIVQSLIRHGHQIRIPVDVENDLSLKFMRKTHEFPGVNIDQNSSKTARITRNLSEHAHHHPKDVNKSLAFIYERELIPLHNIIKNLTEEINTLTAQQEVLKDKQRGAKRTKSLRLIPVNKRCGCGRM